MSTLRLPPLPEPPPGFEYYRSREEILRSRSLLAYQHVLLRAWEEMRLSGVMTLNGVPTVYIRDAKRPLNAKETAGLCRKFWNQGVATVFVLRDAHAVRVFSSMTVPLDERRATDADVRGRVVEQVELATQASWAQRFYTQLGMGHYWSAAERVAWFNPQQGVDAYLLSNLSAVRDKLVEQDLQPQFAHAFLGRVLFTCYLCDREIVNLPNYFQGQSWRHLHELLDALPDPTGALYDTLFPALLTEFNGSLFDVDLEAERHQIRPQHFDIVRAFLRGDDLAEKPGQPSLGFWAYDFKFIPVETISAIYESFLEAEGTAEKRKSGAFYTPRFLAEMALDRVLAPRGALYKEGRRFIDPACGSGIFLVLLFNRLAAEWRSAVQGQPDPQAQAEELLERLDALRGVDKNPTACRIACFSLYLAFLDTFDPPGVRAYKLHTGKKLPALLRRRDARQSPKHPVIWEADFRDLAEDWKGQFDIVIGNPPWGGRGDNQLVHPFMELTPKLLREGGRACLLLPSRVFLNRTDDIQAQWLRCVTLESIVQLADYSEILFRSARSPCCITVFTSGPPDVATHEVEYVVPKVSTAELRDGLIPVEPQDRKWIPLKLLLDATTQETRSLVWKTYLWGTPRDMKLLDYLLTLPRLALYADILSETRGTRTKRWAAGQGCKPQIRGSASDRDLKPLDNWSVDDPFISHDLLGGLAYVPKPLCPTLKEHFSERAYMTDALYSKPDDSLFTGPLVLFNQGFSEFAFVDYVARFQDALQSIAGPEKDADSLLFLLGCLRSKLARYFIFHTASNMATERDKAHLFEVMRLPFFLPCSEAARADASTIVAGVAAAFRKLQDEMNEDAKRFLKERQNSDLGPLFGGDDAESSDKERRKKWAKHHQARTLELQSREIDPLIYRYFGLTDQDRALVEDTCDIFDRSDTPGALIKARMPPTLQAIQDWQGLRDYGDMLTSALRSRTTSGPAIIASGQVDPQLGIGVVEVAQERSRLPFRRLDDAELLLRALSALLDSSKDHSGALVFRRNGLIFDGPRVYIVKPALRGQWTRTAAINDAAELRAHVAEARRNLERS